MTSNMVGPSTTLSKSKENQLAIISKEFDFELFSGLKEILIKPEGICQHTRIQAGAITSVDYNAFVRGVETSNEYSTIADSQSSNSYMEKETFAFMAKTLEKVTNIFEEQARVQKEQQKMLRVQQDSIDDIKAMITQLLTNQKKSLKGSRPNTSSSNNKGKQKQRESSSEKAESENNSNSEPPKSSSEKEDSSNNEGSHSKRMNELEKCLEAIVKQSYLEEVGIV